MQQVAYVTVGIWLYVYREISVRYTEWTTTKQNHKIANVMKIAHTKCYQTQLLLLHYTYWQLPPRAQLVSSFGLHTDSTLGQKSRKNK